MESHGDTQRWTTANSNLTSRLEKLRELALARGADQAVVIPTSEVIVDPRVRLKCMIPKCYMSGACAHCPPHGSSFNETKDTVSRYQWAVFFRVLVDSSVIANEKAPSIIVSGIWDDAGKLNTLGASYMLLASIVKIVQKRAEEMGYTPTFGFAAGDCRDLFCHYQPTCQSLQTRRGCRHPGLSSPSMESCGLDAFTMAARAGWDAYPIGGTCRPESVPHGALMGLVLVT